MAHKSHGRHSRRHRDQDSDEESEEVGHDRFGVPKRGDGPPLSTLVKSVVRLFVTEVQSSYDSPWKKWPQREFSGTGFAINTSRGNVIITNAHVVNDHTVVRVRRPGNPKKFPASVTMIGSSVDLAVVEVADPEFWADLPLLQLSDENALPQLDDDVMAVGYPLGGDGISVTRGVVSRILMSYYVRGGSWLSGGDALLTIQIDAPINPGNSGGPVFNKNGQVVGISRAGLTQAQNIGYIISIQVLNLFLHYFETIGGFPGLVNIQTEFQTLESHSMRKFLQIPEEETGGIHVKKVAELGPANGILRKDDVLLAIDGHAIAQDKSVSLSEGRINERVDYKKLITRHTVGSKIEVTVLRNGEKLTQRITLSSPVRFLPAEHNFDVLPRYMIVGGLVIVPASLPWIYETDKMSPHIMSAMEQFRQEKNRELVIVSKLLNHYVNFGFQKMFRGGHKRGGVTGGHILMEYNGQEVFNLNHLAELIEESTDSYHQFALEDDEQVVLDAEECLAAEQEILEQNSIQSPTMGVIVRPAGERGGHPDAGITQLPFVELNENAVKVERGLSVEGWPDMPGDSYN